MSVTYREICEQFDSMKKTAEHLNRAGLPNLFGTRLAVVGCGSSYSLAKSMARAAYMHTGCHAVAIAGGDLLVHAERYAAALDGGVLLAVSRSGSTSEILLATERLRQLGCSFKLVSIVCVEGSKLSVASDAALELPWAFDQSVCQTRTVSCMYFAFAYLLAKQTGDDALAADLETVVSEGMAFLRRIEEKTKQLAALPWTHVAVLGDAEIGGLCEEGALAFKEICQLPSNYYNLLDSRHGPMVLFGPDTLILAATSGRSDYETAFLRDMQKKGAAVVAITDEAEIEGVETISFGKRLGHISLGFAAIIVCQLVSYFKSFHSGANPDEPDGLAAWIKL